MIRTSYNEPLDGCDLDISIKNIEASFCPFGWLDLKRVAIIANEIGKSSSDINDIIVENADLYEIKIADIDPVACVYDYILHEAQSEMMYNLEYDIQAGDGFYTHGNYLCSAYEYKEEDRKKLLTFLKKADKDKVQKSLENINLAWFLSEIELIVDGKLIKKI